MDATGGAGSSYHSRSPDFIPFFCEVHAAQSSNSKILETPIVES